MTRDAVPRTKRSTLGLLVLLWFAGMSLRSTVLALPPVLERVTAALRLSPFDVGVTTAIPFVVFAAGAVPGALLIRRVGATRCLMVGLVVNAVGAVARGFVDETLTFDVSTAVMCAGVAVMQPAMATLVRAWAPERIALASATYTFGLLVGEIAPVTWPLHLPLPDAAWRSQLVLWAVPVVVTALAIVVARPDAARREGDRVRRSLWPAWSRRELWLVALLMGSIGTVYLGLNGFVPGWLTRAGAGGAIGAVLVALNVAQLPAAVLLMRYGDRWTFAAPAYVVSGAGLLLGSVVLATGPAVAFVVAAALAGFCSAVLLALVLTLQPLLADDETLPAFSAGTFTIGFGLAAVLALATGALDRAGPTWTSVVPMASAAVAIIAVGTAIGRLRVG